MANFTLIGQIIAESDITSGTSKSGKEWSKKEYVISEPGQYVNNVSVTVFNGNIDNFGLAVGQKVELECGISAKENKGRWFNSITAFKAVILGVQEHQYADSVPTDYAPKENSKPAPKNDPIDNTDDLPF